MLLNRGEGERNALEGKPKVFSWWRVIFSGGLSFILTAIGLAFMPTDWSLLFPIMQALIPMAVFAVVFMTMKNREKVYTQVQIGVSIHVVLTMALFMWTSFPSDYGEWASLLNIIFVAAAPSLLIGIALQISSPDL